MKKIVKKDEKNCKKLLTHKKQCDIVISLSQDSGVIYIVCASSSVGRAPDS